MALVTVPMRVSCCHAFVVECLHEISLQSVKESFSVLPANTQIVTQRVLVNYESLVYSLGLFLTSYI